MVVNRHTHSPKQMLSSWRRRERARDYHEYLLSKDPAAHMNGDGKFMPVVLGGQIFEPPGIEIIVHLNQTWLHSRRISKHELS